MAWAGSTRRETLPPDWRSRRERVFARDGFRCTWVDEGGRCPSVGPLECDHVGDRLDHSLENLRTLCSRHHQLRSSMQGAAASHARRRELNELWLREFRPPEVHPGRSVTGAGRPSWMDL